MILPVVLDHRRLGCVGVVLDVEECRACFVGLFGEFDGLFAVGVYCRLLKMWEEGPMLISLLEELLEEVR